MTDLNSLIKTKIKSRQDTYFLTTEGDLNSLSEKSLYIEIFLGLTLLFIGGVISVIITKATGIDLQKETQAVLGILLYVFILVVIIFGVITIHFFYKRKHDITKIKGSGELLSIEHDNSDKGKAETKKATENQVITKSNYSTIIHEKVGQDNNDISKPFKHATKAQIDKLFDENTMEIIEASYGTSEKILNITEELKKLVINNKLNIIASNAIAGDPYPNQVKYLTLKYKYKGHIITKKFLEQARIVIP